MWQGIPAIIAMQYEVEDEPAIVFNDALYTTLSSGLSLDEAMSAGRLAMLKSVDLEDSKKSCVEWGVPVLYSRLVDGKVFPERMARAGAVAEQFRHVFTQNVERVEKNGEVIGVSVERVGSSVQVTQDIGVVLGRVVGIEADKLESGSSTSVNQKVEKVEGTLVGAKIKNL